MTIPEIIGGVIVLIASVLIIILTVSQHTKGQGLSGVLTGGNNPMAGSRVRQEDVMLGKLTKIAAAVLFVVTIVACAVSARMG